MGKHLNNKHWPVRAVVLELLQRGCADTHGLANPLQLLFLAHLLRRGSQPGRGSNPASPFGHVFPFGLHVHSSKPSMYHVTRQAQREHSG